MEDLVALRETRLSKLFGLLDLDDDDQFVVEEYKELVDAMKPAVEDESVEVSDKVKAMFSKLDEDGDGQVRAEEFVAFYMVACPSPLFTLYRLFFLAIP